MDNGLYVVSVLSKKRTQKTIKLDRAHLQEMLMSRTPNCDPFTRKVKSKYQGISETENSSFFFFYLNEALVVVKRCYEITFLLFAALSKESPHFLSSDTPPS